MIIGLTGGIGSGKSTVLKMFQDLGARVFIADVEAKKLMNTNAALKQQIIELLGEESYKDNQLNREFIASIIFSNKEKLSQLNALVHPKVKEAFLSKVKENKKEVIIYEAAILFESGSNQFCDFVITVVADESIRIERVSNRDGVKKTEVLKRIQNQTDDYSKMLKSNFVIKNHRIHSTKQQVFTIFDLIRKIKI
jgi:dephospho-CoA kinase